MTESTSSIISRNVVKNQANEDVVVCIRRWTKDDATYFDVFVNGGFLSDGTDLYTASTIGDAFRAAAEEAERAHRS
jgi:hypothetical protein